MTAVMSGEVQLSLAPVSVAVAQANVGKVTVGKVKALAITSRNRYSGAPDVPAIAEAGLPGFEATIWFDAIALSMHATQPRLNPLDLLHDSERLCRDHRYQLSCRPAES